MKARVFLVIAALAAICCSSCPSSTSYNPQRRGEYTLGTHSFYYTITSATAPTTTTAEVTVTNAIDGADDLGILSIPLTTSPYTVTLSGSAMRVDISGTANDSGAINITLYIYEDGTLLASQAFSGTSPLSFDLGAFL